MAFLDNYLKARAIRTNPNFARMQMAQQQRDFDLQDLDANRRFLESIMGSRGQSAIPEQREAVGGLMDASLFADDAPQMTEPYVEGGGAPAQWTPDQSVGLIGEMSMPEITAPALPATNIPEVVTQEGQEATPGTGIFGDEMDQREAWYRQQMAPLKDVRGYGADLLSQNLTPPTPVKPSAFAEKMAAWNDPNKRAILMDMQQAGMSPLGGQNISIDIPSPYDQPETPGQEKIDKQYADQYLAFTQSGASDQAKMIGQLKDAQKVLESGDVNISGALVGNLPDWLRVLGPGGGEAISVREGVEEVVQRNLREVLGAQFTEKEGERLIKRAFNPLLSEEENSRRLTRLIKSIESAYESKQSAADYYETYGTLKGWKGKLPSISDFQMMEFDDGKDDPMNIRRGRNKT